ncbi:hypothetical protein R1sor_007200 [Riccia sorocarpa]|uniref:PDZ domain-containing protein n=1 Tax=Riccia sorocarpa TaxID=122646 RepID=A0ABD3HSH5_9MARC
MAATAARYSPCCNSISQSKYFQDVICTNGKSSSHFSAGRIRQRNHGAVGSNGPAGRCSWGSSLKLRISPELEAVNWEYTERLVRRSSAASVFSPKQQRQQSKENVRKGSSIVAFAKRRSQKSDSKKSQKLALGAGLTREEQENVLELLTDSGLNGSWLYKDDEFDDLDDAPFLDAVVKVYTTRSEPNFSLPWQKMRQYSVTGSGFMITRRRLLTNAHCVEHHTQVKVKRRGNDTKFVATVLAVGRECDIALLSVEDEEFWADVEPLEFGGLPRLQDPVTVVGYPIGGETISVTSGVVSRVEITSYAHGATELLAVQIDAAINPGNSGGPAFDEDGECVGIAFQSIDASDAENIGYVIPTPVIKHFLVDYERNGENTGFPSCGLLWQRLENSALRAALRMAQNQRGVLIRRVEPTSPAFQVLKAGDVLMKFDGVPVANEGTVPFQAGERIAFTFLASQKYSGDMVEVEVLRDGEVMTLQTAVKSPTRLVPVHIDGKLPSYLIVAGFVFTVVSQPFLESHFGMDYDANLPVKILEKATYGMAQFEDEQLVVVSQVLASDVNVGYEDIEAAQVLTFNGTKIRNLSQLAQLADACEDRFIQIELDNEMLVVLETQQARTAIPQILRDHCIPTDRSGDLLVSSA